MARIPSLRSARSPEAASGGDGDAVSGDARLLRAFLAAVAIPIAMIPFVEAESLLVLVLIAAVQAAAAGAVVWRARRSGGRGARAWRLLALAAVLSAVGPLCNLLAHSLGARPLFHVLGTIAVIGALAGFTAGLVLLIRSRTEGPDWDGLIDSLIVAVAVGAVMWFIVFRLLETSPLAHRNATAALLPLLDVAVLAIALRLELGAGRRCVAARLAVLAVVASLAGDLLNAAVQLDRGALGSSAQFAAWIGGPVAAALLGAAALHPSAPLLSTAVAPDRGLSRRRLQVLTAAALVAPALICFELVRDGAGAGLSSNEALALAGEMAAALALFLLVVVRMNRLAGLERDLRRYDALVARAAADLLGAATPAEVETAVCTAVGRIAGAGTEVWVAELADAQASLGPAEQATLLDGDVVSTHRRVIAPLPVREGVTRVLMVERSLDPAQESALGTVALQAALALEAAHVAGRVAREDAERRFSSLVSRSKDLILVLDAADRVVDASPAADRVLGESPEALLGRILEDLLGDDSAAHVRTAFAKLGPGADCALEVDAVLQGGRRIALELQVTNRLDDPLVNGRVVNVRDISERRSFEKERLHRALHDPITGLPNRALLLERTSHAIERACGRGRQVAVLVIDLNDFKAVNDALGHSAGDQLLKDVARRVEAVAIGETAARLGGDEFALLLEDIGSDDEAVETAGRILDALATPFQLDDGDVIVRAELGIAFADEPGADAESLLRNADMAMYAAKASATGAWAVYHPSMHGAVLERLRIKTELQKSIDAGDFTLRWQPIVNLATGRLRGFEVLVRWLHPGDGLVGPDDFIPLAEDTGLIVPLGRWILREACGQAVRMAEARSDAPPTTSVNISARQLQDPGVIDDVRDALAESGLTPSLLVLELTESAVMRDLETAIARMRDLRALGVRIALDDFGTGQSSLTAVRRFPIDYLKLDKGFIDAVAHDAEEALLVGGILGLARSLNLTAVAEGVETLEQADALRAMECPLAQGFLFARPLEAAAALTLLQTGEGIAA